jgi:L-alanine-DL-glutamate epimerase-like enolase superfamily enzyme
VKITGINIVRKTCRFEPKYQSEARSVGPLDAWEEYAFAESRKNSRSGAEKKVPGTQTGHFIEITTDEGFTGCYGIIENRAELLTIMDGLAAHLVGRDPLENRVIWDILSRFDRHSRGGVMMMAISAVDIALWDLKGKILGLPVYRILGGGRRRIKPYISALGFSVEKEAAKKRALEIKAMGVNAQKWFFRYGPSDGAAGIRKNLDLAFALREALGDDYELMFDCWMGWTVNYALKIFPELEKLRPAWVEEVLRPQMAEGYRHLKAETTIPLSAGEHFYTRMEVNGYLKDNIFAVMQSDPVWCGGISECLRIAELCEIYGTVLIPHGHALLPAMQVVASMPADTCPYCEYLLVFMDQKNAFLKVNRLGSDGYLTLNDNPGLGEDIDEERLISSETIHSFGF